MTDPLHTPPLTSLAPPASTTSAPAASGPTGVGAASRAADGPDFQTYLLDRLAEVNHLQKQANEGVERLVTGRTDHVAEVMSAMRKADIAFSMMMEIRNKLLDAYAEIRQMRV